MTEAISNGNGSHAHELKLLPATTTGKFDGEAFVKVPPLDFSFENIKYEVTMRSGKKI